MAEMKQFASHVIGDVVASRDAPDRAALHRRLAEVLDLANQRFGSDLRVTVGDEYQGSFATLGGALAATGWVRVQLLPEVDVRHGVGTGPVSVLDGATGIQDGPGWWAAREAIEAAEALADRPRTRTLRTACRVAHDDGTGLVRAVNAALAGRDHLVSSLDVRALSVLRGMLAGRTQQEVAADEGVSPSAVSQRVRADGVGVLLEIDAWLEELG